MISWAKQNTSIIAILLVFHPMKSCHMRTEEHGRTLRQRSIFLHIKGLHYVMVTSLHRTFSLYWCLKGVLFPCADWRVASQQQLADSVSGCIKHDSEENMKYLNIWKVMNNTCAASKGHRAFSLLLLSLFFPSVPRREQSAHWISSPIN